MKLLLTFILFITLLQSHANDTLYFRLANPWYSVKANNGKYLRKAILTKDSGWLALDYTDDNILIGRGHYTDTLFQTQLFCHYYYHDYKGYLEEVRCYKNGKLDGKRIRLNENGDTLWIQTIRQNVLLNQKILRQSEIDYDRTFTKLEVEAEFPGGADAWSTYLKQNLQYPKKAIRKNIQGTVVVHFIVDNEGYITNIELVQKVDPLLDEEALRLIKQSGFWVPGFQNGRRVQSYKRVPIEFRL